MGSCASIHRNSDSAMNFRLSIGSKTNEMTIPPSPIKDNLTPINGGAGAGGVFVKSHRTPSSHLGSKDETFFDTRGWLDSDCDDDFYSVNGDFTPSRGNTPVHHNFASGTPRINQVIDDRTLITIPGPSPTGKKKLAELFRESSRNATGIQTKPTLNELALQSNPETPYLTGTTTSRCSSSERTPNGDVWIEKERQFGSVQCCLPNLGSCRRSFGDRRKKASPVITV